MTMLDDDRLTSLLARAGASFEVPADGAATIVARATGPTPASDDAPPVAAAAGGDGDGDGSSDGDGSGRDGDAPGAGGVLPRLARTARRHRILTAAACLLVAFVVAGTVGALLRSPARQQVTSSLAGTPGRSSPPSATAPRTNGRLPARRAPGAPSASPKEFAPAGASATPAVTVPSTSPALPSGAVNQPAKIEQTGSLGLRVARGTLARTMTQLTNLAVAFNGFVASSQAQSGAGSGGAPYASITLQVPVDSFSAALKQAQGLGKTIQLSTHATDVTGQYVDLQSRVAALEASRQQYLTIMARATTIGDVLAVQAQLDTIQSQIEQLQGQLQVLTSNTAYSSLSVTVSEGVPPPRPGPLPESGVVRSWHDSVGGFVDGVEGLIRLAGPALFVLLCLGVLVVGGRVLWRRYQRHNL